MSDKQTRLLQLTGETQKMTFYRKKNGEYAFKRKGGISPENYATNPLYERMRTVNMEFTTACRSASLIKRAFASVLPRHAVTSAYQRLMTKCREVLKTDSSHEKGYRQVIDGDANLFRNFEFTADAKFNSVLFVQPTYSFDRATGNVTVGLPALDPAIMIHAPAKATHYRLTLSVATVDFAVETFGIFYTESTDIALNAGLAEALTLTAGVGANTTTAVFTALTIQFITTEGDDAVLIGGNKFNLMRMIAADFPA